MQSRQVKKVCTHHIYTSYAYYLQGKHYKIGLCRRILLNLFGRYVFSIYFCRIKKIEMILMMSFRLVLSHITDKKSKKR